MNLSFESRHPQQTTTYLKLFLSGSHEVLTASLARVQPLSSGSGSSWELFFRDNDLIVEIDRDVRRTMPSMALFQQPSGAPNALLAGHDYGKVLAERLEFSRKRSAYQNQRQTTGAFEPSPDGSELHWEVIRRMLFVYAKVNPGIRYVQGMNDLLAIIYYVMVQHASSEWKGMAKMMTTVVVLTIDYNDDVLAEWAEPDTFWCFVVLMGERQDMFLKSLDNSAVGVKAQLAAFDGLLKRIDFQLWISLVRPSLSLFLIASYRPSCRPARLQNGKGLDPSFYAFRWMTLLMSHEFEVPDTIRLWDSLLADPNRFEFLSYFCIAMMEHLRDHLLRNDFGECLSTLQV